MARLLHFLYPNNILSFLCLALLCLVFLAPIAFVLDGIDSNIFELVIFLFLFCTFLLITFFAFRSHGVKLFDKTLFKIEINIKMVLIVIGFQLFINTPLNYFVGKGEEITFTSLYLFMVVCAAPIIEEFIFRGVFLRALLSKYSANKAIFFSAVIFALIHIQPMQMLGALALGLYFGYVFTKTKSFSTVAILHMIANLVGLLGKQMLHLVW